jgi:hypothetical protein
MKREKTINLRGKVRKRIDDKTYHEMRNQILANGLMRKWNHKAQGQAWSQLQSRLCNRIRIEVRHQLWH